MPLTDKSKRVQLRTWLGRKPRKWAPVPQGCVLSWSEESLLSGSWVLPRSPESDAFPAYPEKAQAKCASPPWAESLPCSRSALRVFSCSQTLG